jgi:RPA family protein
MSESEQSGAGRREVAYRLFAAEFDDADFSYSESDEERAPNYVITPTGARVNRLFVVGVLTEVEEVSDDVLRARVVDPTGAFVLYAGQYQPDEQAFLDGARTPMFVALTGKARTFQPDDSDQVFTSVRPESISEVDAETRDRWTVQTAEQTIERAGHMATALPLDVRGEDLRMTLGDNGIDDGLAAGIPPAINHYGTTGAYLTALRETAVDCARLVAADLDEVSELSVSPGDGDDGDLSGLADTDIEASVSAEDTSTETGTAASGDGTATETTGVPETASADDAGATDAASADPEPAEPDPTDSEPSEPEPTESETTQRETVEAPAAAAGGGQGTGEAATGSEDEMTADDPSGADTEDDDIGDFEPGEFDLDEEEREEIEQEYGTEFQSGTDVPEPGEADIETPDPEELDKAEAEADAGAVKTPAESAPEPESQEPTTPEGEPTEPTADNGPVEEEAADEETAEPAEDVDLEDATVEVMGELDDGDGADRKTLIETVAQRYDASPDEVEDAIQDALMGGRCYEPDDRTVKPI